MSRSRQFSVLDQILVQVDQALKAVAAPAQASRPTPQASEATELNTSEQRHAAGLMRVNHVGEVCAQALYQGQAAASQSEEVRQAMQQAVIEEQDHLAWCEQRLQSLDSRPSLLNPLWYAGAYAMGLLAGKVGDEWSLGFVVETENQVEAHLAGHLEKLPAHDHASRAIVEQMRLDEIAHAQTAQTQGARVLPTGVKRLMGLASKVMTTTAYYL